MSFYLALARARFGSLTGRPNPPDAPLIGTTLVLALAGLSGISGRVASELCDTVWGR